MNNKPCVHAEICGGCTYQGIPYDEELKIKEATVRELLARYHENKFEGIIAAPSKDGYRNKMEFAFGDACKNGPLALGIRKRRSFYEVVTPEGCMIIPADFKKILLVVLEYFTENDETFYHRKTHAGALRYLILRRGAFTGEVLVNLVTTSYLRVPLAPLVEQVCRLSISGEVAGFLHTVNDGVADTVKNENVHILTGRDYFYENICGLRFKISAFSFFQTNSAGAERLYEIVRDYAGKSRLLYDLYCGTGTITQVLSQNAREAVGVELSEEAVAAAGENAAMNGITNVSFTAGDVLTVLDTTTERTGLPDVIVVDPPRDGLHPKSLQKIINLQAERVVYVSCKPSSLARDMDIFIQNGYKTERIVCVDMFPRTGHVETVALMTKEDEER